MYRGTCVCVCRKKKKKKKELLFNNKSWITRNSGKHTHTRTNGFVMYIMPPTGATCVCRSARVCNSSLHRCVCAAVTQVERTLPCVFQVPLASGRGSMRYSFFTLIIVETVDFGTASTPGRFVVSLSLSHPLSAANYLWHLSLSTLVHFISLSLIRLKETLEWSLHKSKRTQVMKTYY